MKTKLESIHAIAPFTRIILTAIQEGRVNNAEDVGYLLASSLSELKPKAMDRFDWAARVGELMEMVAPFDRPANFKPSKDPAAIIAWLDRECPGCSMFVTNTKYKRAGFMKGFNRFVMEVNRPILGG